MKYIFGPVNSRRLGRSLGIDFYLEKTCNFNCVYCEVGRGKPLATRRSEYTNTAEILQELKKFCGDRQSLEKVDSITITGSGEPTLHTGLKEILEYLKNHQQKPVTVITNGSTLMRSDVQQELCLADRVIPSLDSALAGSFRKVDRPAHGIDVEEIISGLEAFTRMFTGSVWLEVLLVRGINDSPEDTDALIAALERIQPERVQLNTVFRPPPESFARPLTNEQMTNIASKWREALSVPIDLPAPATDVEAPEVSPREAAPPCDEQELAEAIVQMIKRRPCTAADINRTFQVGGPEKIEQLLAPYVQRGAVSIHRHENHIFYQ